MILLACATSSDADCAVPSGARSAGAACIYLYRLAHPADLLECRPARVPAPVSPCSHNPCTADLYAYRLDIPLGTVCPSAAHLLIYGLICSLTAPSEAMLLLVLCRLRCVPSGRSPVSRRRPCGPPPVRCLLVWPTQEQDAGAGDPPAALPGGCRPGGSGSAWRGV